MIKFTEKICEDCNLGIGTTAPTDTLKVVGTANITSTLYKGTSTSSTSTTSSTTSQNSITGNAVNEAGLETDLTSILEPESNATTGTTKTTTETSVVPLPQLPKIII